MPNCLFLQTLSYDIFFITLYQTKHMQCFQFTLDSCPWFADPSPYISRT